MSEVKLEYVEGRRPTYEGKFSARVWGVQIFAETPAEALELLAAALAGNSRERRERHERYQKRPTERT